LQRQLQGGCDQTSCIAELAGALGAQLLVTGSIGRLEELYTLNIKLVDIATVRTKLSASRHAAKLDQLLVQLPDLVAELDRASPPPIRKGAAKEMERVRKKMEAPLPPMPKGLARLRVFVLASFFDGEIVDGLGLSADWRLNRRFGLQATYMNSPGLHDCSIIDAGTPVRYGTDEPDGFEAAGLPNYLSDDKDDVSDTCVSASGWRADIRLRHHLFQSLPQLAFFAAVTYRSVSYDAYVYWESSSTRAEHEYRLRSLQASNFNLAPGISYDLRIAAGAHLRLAFGMRIPLNSYPAKEFSTYSAYNLFLVETGLGWVF
jgi:hypothetical protein